MFQNLGSFSTQLGLYDPLSFGYDISILFFNPHLGYVLLWNKGNKIVIHTFESLSLREQEEVTKAKLKESLFLPFFSFADIP